MPYRLAEFASCEELVAAAKTLRAAGYRRLEAYTPFAVPELVEVLDIPRSRAPQLIFGAALFGGASAALLQWYCNAHDYPLNVGGRPLASLPAWVPIMFELTVLAAAITGFVMLIVGGGMPRLHHPLDRIEGSERGTLDRHLLAIELGDPKFVPARCAEVLAAHGALSVRDDEEVT